MWSSLEVVKLLVGILTPAAIVFLGQWLTRHAKVQELRSARQSAVIQKRVELWDRALAGPLNDIYSYFEYVGQWKELSAAKIIGSKRNLDRTVYSFLPFFSAEFSSAYFELMNQCFATYGGWGRDARLRTSRAHRKNEEPGAEQAFTDEDNASQIHRAYFKLLGVAANEFDVEIMAPPNAPKTPQGT